MDSAPSGSSPKQPLLSGSVGDLPVVVCGLGTAVAVVVLDWLLKMLLGFNFPSLMFWFVVPAGALLTGAAAASGFYLGAKYLHHMPSRRILLNMVLIGASTWLTLQWTDWRTAKFSDTGTSVAEVVPFVEYWKWNTEHMSYSVRTRTGAGGDLGEMGSWGYWAAGLQFVGFLLGGFAMYVFLSEQRACTACRRYYKSRSILPNIVDGRELVALFERAELALPDIVSATKARIGDKAFRGFALVQDTCPGCGATQMAFMVHYGRDESALVDVFRCTPEQIAKLKAAVPPGKARSPEPAA